MERDSTCREAYFLQRFRDNFSTITVHRMHVSITEYYRQKQIIERNYLSFCQDEGNVF